MDAHEAASVDEGEEVMGDARNKRRVENRLMKKISPPSTTSFPFAVTFGNEGDDSAQHVALFYGEEPTDETILVSCPVRGKLTMERKEDIVCKLMTLASACFFSGGKPQVFLPGDVERDPDAFQGGEDGGSDENDLSPWPKFTKHEGNKE